MCWHFRTWPTSVEGGAHASAKGHLALAVFRCFSCPRASRDILECLRMSQDALGQLKHLKTARARWPFPDQWETLASVVFDACRWYWEAKGGVEVNLNVQQVNMSCDHVHT